MARVFDDEGIELDYMSVESAMNFCDPAEHPDYTWAFGPGDSYDSLGFDIEAESLPPEEFEGDWWPIKSKFNNVCKDCGSRVLKGDEVYYYPEAPPTRKIRCSHCFSRCNR